jgi:hypothetical protein
VHRKSYNEQLQFWAWLFLQEAMGHIGRGMRVRASARKASAEAWVVAVVGLYMNAAMEARQPRAFLPLAVGVLLAQ